jgi:thiosulfate/3-mercaptopyruvate sulfurtransferase
MHTHLITVEQLKALDPKNCLVFDVSADLMNPEAGLQMYGQEHIAGAVHADLNEHLSESDPAYAVNGGRHPLPQREVLAQWLRSVGLNNDMQVVVCDRQGANYCARLWWMIKWCGHDAVAVLDGGFQAWQKSGGAITRGIENPRPAGTFSLAPPLVTWRTTAEVAAQVGHPAQTLIDARAPARFKGETEPLDPVAGHIPGALNRPFALNLDANGFFKSPEVLKQEFDLLLAGRDPASVVHHCGSGVSALPNLLAMAVAGLGTTALYPGSWSEWCTTPGMVCAKG